MPIVEYLSSMFNRDTAKHMFALASVSLVMCSVVRFTAHAQVLSEPPWVSSLSFNNLSDLLLPAAAVAAFNTRTWVRDSLGKYAASFDDVSRMDMIYVRALYEADGNHARALFAAMYAVLEHRTIPFKFGLSLPLTLESDAAFKLRFQNLPDTLFADHPHGNDRDKLQHFFASAWMACAMDQDFVPDIIGHMIESGEAALIKSGVTDTRDIRANRLGHLFAKLLLTHPNALPSDLIRAWNREYMRRGP